MFLKAGKEKAETIYQLLRQMLLQSETTIREQEGGTRWDPEPIVLNGDMSYNHYTWPYNWRIGVVTVITVTYWGYNPHLYTTSRGPPCSSFFWFSAAIIQLARDIFIISLMRTSDSKNLRVFKDTQGLHYFIISLNLRVFKDTQVQKNNYFNKIGKDICPRWFKVMVVSTHLKNISQIGNLPQIGVKIKNVWNQHLGPFYPLVGGHLTSERPSPKKVHNRRIARSTSSPPHFSGWWFFQNMVEAITKYIILGETFWKNEKICEYTLKKKTQTLVSKLVDVFNTLTIVSWCGNYLHQKKTPTKHRPLYYQPNRCHIIYKGNPPKIPRLPATVAAYNWSPQKMGPM